MTYIGGKCQNWHFWEFSVSVLQEKGAFLWYMYFFSFLVFGPVEDEKEDHQCLGHWSECKFKLVPIVCNHSGGGGHRTKKKIPLCLFVFLFLLHYLCMYCYILSIAKVKTSSFLVCSCKKSERDTVSCVINNEKTKY